MKKSEMIVNSTSFKHEGDLLKKYTAYGENISPNLSWENIPAGTKSFAIICDDPDAKPVCGFEFIHWLVKDIPADVKEFPENKCLGTNIQNNAKTESYFGPRPPDKTGKHKYIFKIYAIDIEKLPASNSEEMYKIKLTGKECEKHKLAQGTIIGCYEFGMP